MECLNQEEIIRLEDKDLQLRYILGGFYPRGENNHCSWYWSCDVLCLCEPVEDDKNFQKVKNFIKKYNISNSTFLRLTYTYLKGNFDYHKRKPGNLIPDLVNSISGYKFSHINNKNRFKGDVATEAGLKTIIKYKASDKDLNIFLEKYTLTPTDFVILANNSVNHKYITGRGFDVEDMPKDLKELLKKYELKPSYKLDNDYNKEENGKRKIVLLKRKKAN